MGYWRISKDKLEVTELVTSYPVGFKIPVRIDTDKIKWDSVFLDRLEHLLKTTVLQRFEQAIFRHQLAIEGRVAAVRQNDYGAPSRHLSEFAAQNPVECVVQVCSTDRFRVYQFG